MIFNTTAADDKPEMTAQLISSLSFLLHEFGVTSPRLHVSLFLSGHSTVNEIKLVRRTASA